MSDSKVELPHKASLLNFKTNMELSSISEQLRSTASTNNSLKDSPLKKKLANSTIFYYDQELLTLCETYLANRDYQGLALLARQKGLPPFLRFKIWPILLKKHPFVLKPFIQPDSIDDDDSYINEDEAKSTSSHNEQDIETTIAKDLKKYIKRLSYSRDMKQLSHVEQLIFDILLKSISRFVKKWGKVVRYDPAMTWIALGLAEWIPPIANTTHILNGRDSKQDAFYTNLFDDYQEFIKKYPQLATLIDEAVEEDSIMSFQEIYERLVLVLLHSPEEVSSKSALSRKTLPLKGGTIEEKVSFFIYIFRRLLPELSTYFDEEQILNKFGSNDDEWLIWWLKWCGSKVWSRIDRGRIWDLILGWRTYNPKKDSNLAESLGLNKELIEKLGPDIFWSPINKSESSDNHQSPQQPQEKDQNRKILRRDSFKNLLSSLTLSDTESVNDEILEIPFSTLDPHFELIFIGIAILKSKENELVELEQNEIRQFLSKLPSNNNKSFSNHHDNYNSLSTINSNSSNVSGSNNADDASSISSSSEESKLLKSSNFIENIIIEAGDLWRNWLWKEMVSENE